MLVGDLLINGDGENKKKKVTTVVEREKGKKTSHFPIDRIVYTADTARYNAKSNCWRFSKS